ncbi:MAG: LptF/LptG family permease [Elusimicrobiota bacterium]|nr:LptF/LptG family permease [Elusimicrobiota bacterium]
MSIITRYIYHQLFKSFSVGVVIFTFVLLLNNLFQLVDLIILKGAKLPVVLQLLLYSVLTLLNLTVPVSALFAILLTYGRMSEDNEITALKASGINYFRFVYQSLLIGLILCIILCYANMSIIPELHTEFRRMYFSIIKKEPIAKFSRKTFIDIGDYKIYINEIDKKRNILKGVCIYKLGLEPKRIFARRGSVDFSKEKKIVFELFDGIMQSGNLQDPESLTHFAFKNYVVTIPYQVEDTLKEIKTLREFTGKELLKEIKKYQMQNLPTNYLQTEYYLRLSISFAVLSFVLVGLPLAVRIHRSSRTIALGLSVLIIGVYYFLLIGSITIAESAVLPAGLVMWIPNIVFFSVGILFTIKFFKT